MKRKLLSVILAAAMVTAMLAGCGSKQEEAPAATGGEAGTEAPAAEGEAEAPAESAGGAGGLVGVAMPTKDLQRWNQDGSNMKAELEAAGYTVDLQYASNDNATMVSQIETMIAN